MKTGPAKIIDHPLITEVLFYPSSLTENQVPGLERGQTLRLPVGSDLLGAYLYNPLPNGPVTLFFHGNGEVMTDYLTGFHQQVESSGANFMVVDYRGYGLSTGSPTLSRLIEDANAAWSFATSGLGLEEDRIIIMGRSLGSLAALEIAGDKGQNAKALIIESGIARFDAWIDRMAAMLERLGLNVRELKEGLLKAFNQEKKIKAFNGKVLVMHAPFDEIVPVENGRALGKWAPADRSRLVIFPRGGHNDIHFVNQTEYFQVLKEFILSLD